MFKELIIEDGKVKTVEEEVNGQKIHKPVYLDDKGQQVPVDVPSMYQKIIDLGQEAKSHRVAKDELQKKFEIFDDVEDIAAWHSEALKAMDAVKNFNDKDWLEAKKVEEAKNAMVTAHAKEIERTKESFAEKIGTLEGSIDLKNSQLRRFVVSNKFATCGLFAGEGRKTTMSPDAAEALFGPFFTIEENSVDPTDVSVRCYRDLKHEKLIYSTTNPGEPADFEEGMVELWENYPQKDNYLRSADRGSGGGGGNKNNMTPTDELSQLEEQLKTAVEAKDTLRSVVIKNKIADIRKAQARRQQAQQ